MKKVDKKVLRFLELSEKFTQKTSRIQEIEALKNNDDGIIGTTEISLASSHHSFRGTSRADISN